MSARWANLALRLLSLTAKMLLTLYMARFVSLADIGEYGLVVGTVAILINVLGIRLDYAVSRDLVGASTLDSLRIMRDAFLFYGFNYLVLACIMAILILAQITRVSNQSLTAIYILSILESCSNLMFINMMSLRRPILANSMFFMRSGLWVFPLIALGIFWGICRTGGAVLSAWAIGAMTSIAFTLWQWRSLPWESLRCVVVDWKWLRRSIGGCGLIWISTVGLTAGTFVDRFVVASYLNLDLAGVVTLYASFTSALFSLVESAVFYRYPSLISLYRNNDQAALNREARRLIGTAAVLAGFIAICLAIFVPIVGAITERPLLVDNSPTLWLMLLGTWIRIVAQAFYFILFATNRDRAIWLGDLLYIFPALGGNVILVPIFGLIGIGYCSIISSSLILLWRAWHLHNACLLRDVASIDLLNGDR